ncbi:branched-chain amino acid transport (plasmid) [Stanieria cyanosphaera PCC 7437]|uniref:Branched-chain amino acid transport n=1 Tax=Stanieria cyanosphaera (strain ATCC 29371 / PCC 7437) TaxID=111780 RepID=K9Y114_STAC7|nr:AzlD domain-containing protein [Stanieria cyanosphaera]AFZ38061.1 branched-chain amino acid transport [Stanieria cyanosphaera PCC 7437]
MNDKTILCLIVGMLLATWFSRLLPVAIVSRIKLSPFFESWLKGVPYAALGVLIFPGVISADPESSWTGIIGGMVALLFSLSRLPTFYAVVASVCAASIFKLMGSF